MSFLSRLRPQHLRLIAAIANLGKVQLAAEVLAMSQPAASRILAEVEADIGAPLFERLPRGMRPTELGLQVLHRATVILEEYDALDKDVAMLRSGQAGKVRIGTVTGPALGYVMPAIRHLRATAPEVEATIHVAPSAELIRGLENRVFDMIIARLPPGYDVRMLNVTPARNERVALLVHATHPYAGQGLCCLGDLLAFDWVMQERGAPIRQAVESAFFNARLPLPDKVTTSSSLLVALDMIAAGPAIAPVAQEVASFLTDEGAGARVTVLQIEGTIAVEPYFVILHRHHAKTEAVMRLYHHVLEIL